MREPAKRCQRTLAGLIACSLACTSTAEAAGNLVAALAASPRSRPPLQSGRKLPAEGGEQRSASSASCSGAGNGHPLKLDCELGAAGRGAARAVAVSVVERLSELAESATLAEETPACGPHRSGRGLQLACWMVAPEARMRLSRSISLAQAGSSTAADTRGDAAASTEPAQDGSRLGLRAVLSIVDWRLAPPVWNGYLASELRMASGSGQPDRMQNVQMANLRARSYVWQPWFAQVTGQLGFVQSTDRAKGGEGDIQGSSDSNSITGGGTLTVLPDSRFPLTALFDVSDSRAGGGLTRSEYTNTRIGLRQDYRSEEGDANYSMNYDRSTLEANTFGRDTVDVVGANLTRQLEEHSFNFDGNLSRNRRNDQGDGSEHYRVTGRHVYRPDELLSVDSLASYNGSQTRLSSGGVPLRDRSEFLQYNSFATWRPNEDVPLFISGGGRFFQSVTNFGGASQESQTLSGNAAANYRLGRNLTVSGSGVVTQTQSAGASDLFASQAAALSYAPDVIPWGGFLYRWNAGVDANHVSSQRIGDRLGLGGTVSHGLSRDFATGPASSLGTNVGQNYSTRMDSVSDASGSLQHSIGLSWRISPGPSSSLFLSATAADARSTGASNSQFQLFNFQASGQLQFSRYMSGSANLTLQATRQGDAGLAAPSTSVTTQGNFGFQHGRVFNVPQLRYAAVFSANESQSRSRLQGDVDATRETVSQSFEQRLEYRIGRLDLRLSARTATIEGRRDMLVFLRVQRDFGDF